MGGFIVELEAKVIHQVGGNRDVALEILNFLVRRDHLSREPTGLPVLRFPGRGAEWDLLGGEFQAAQPHEVLGLIPMTAHDCPCMEVEREVSHSLQSSRELVAHSDPLPAFPSLIPSFPRTHIFLLWSV